MLPRILVLTMAAVASTASIHAPAMAADPPASAAQSPEVKKELKKLMNAHGAGEMSSKEYKARKEALLKGQPKA
ncbi:MAG: hypothetical protein FJX59_10045 [Alphaproteobacteria bacterium]|nr:hypothetical protein [Alphaproteobacteria bacterium]